MKIDIEENIKCSRGVGDLPFIQKGSFRSELLPAKVRHRRDVLFSFEDFIGALNVGQIQIQNTINFRANFRFSVIWWCCYTILGH